MTTHNISFSKWTAEGPIRVQFTIIRTSRQEARTIAAKEAAALKGYRYAGCD